MHFIVKENLPLGAWVGERPGPASVKFRLPLTPYQVYHLRQIAPGFRGESSEDSRRELIPVKEEKNGSN